MGYVTTLLEKGRQMKSRVYCLYRGMYDPRVPWYVKLLTILVLAYVISPVDIIPDFIPVLGLLDEVILVPVAIALIVRLMPAEVINEYQGEQQEIRSRGLKITGVLLVAGIWLVLIMLGYIIWTR